MTIYYNAQDRKPLVKAISEFTGADGVPAGIHEIRKERSAETEQICRQWI